MLSSYSSLIGHKSEVVSLLARNHFLTNFHLINICSEDKVDLNRKTNCRANHYVSGCYAVRVCSFMTNERHDLLVLKFFSGCGCMEQYDYTVKVHTPSVSEYKACYLVLNYMEWTILNIPFSHLPSSNLPILIYILNIPFFNPCA